LAGEIVSKMNYSVSNETLTLSPPIPLRLYTLPRPQGICTQNFVKISPAVPEICSQTDRHTQTDRLITMLHTATRAQ